MLGLLHRELYTMLWKYPYNWLGSMAAINSCPSIKWFKWPRKRPYISCCPLRSTPHPPATPERNRLLVPFANPVWCRRCPHGPFPSTLPDSYSENFLRAPIFHHPEQNCSETARDQKAPQSILSSRLCKAIFKCHYSICMPMRLGLQLIIFRCWQPNRMRV